jgi:hypothetical protein
LAFGLPLVCNMRALDLLNVETAIVFRALSTLIVAFVEATFMGQVGHDASLVASGFGRLSSLAILTRQLLLSTAA